MVIRSKRTVLIVIGFVCCVTLFASQLNFHHFNHQPNQSTTTIKNQLVTISTTRSPRMRFRPKFPLILVWTEYFHREWIEKGKKIFTSPDCRFSYDRSDIDHAHAVVFHLRDLNMTDLPDFKRRGQKWVLYNLESPFNSG